MANTGAPAACAIHSPAARGVHARDVQTAGSPVDNSVPKPSWLCPRGRAVAQVAIPRPGRCCHDRPVPVERGGERGIVRSIRDALAVGLGAPSREGRGILPAVGFWLRRCRDRRHGRRCSPLGRYATLKPRFEPSVAVLAPHGARVMAAPPSDRGGGLSEMSAGREARERSRKRSGYPFEGSVATFKLRVGAGAVGVCLGLKRPVRTLR